MKVSMIALAFAALAATASAYAVPSSDAARYDTPQTHQWTPDQTGTPGKTRKEVRQELVRAQKDGQLAALNKLYQGS